MPESAGMKKAPPGFTLIELIVTVALVAVLAAIALPSFSTMMQRNSSTNDANQLVSVLTLARSEAIKRNGQVVACPTTQTEDASMACESTDWNEGILVFADADRSGSFDSGEEIIRIAVPFTTSTTIAADSAVADGIGYGGTGLLAYPTAFIEAGADAGFTVTAGSHDVTVSISPTGRPSVDD